MNDKINITILLVDDEPEILELLEEEFKYVGYSTKTATSGNDAIKILSEQKIDFIVSDYKMPDGDGMSVLKYVNGMNKSPPFFFVSGQADISVEETIRAGAKRFFLKPFDLDKLILDIEEDISDLLTGPR